MIQISYRLFKHSFKSFFTQKFQETKEFIMAYYLLRFKFSMAFKSNFTKCRSKVVKNYKIEEKKTNIIKVWCYTIKKMCNLKIFEVLFRSYGVKKLRNQASIFPNVQDFNSSKLLIHNINKMRINQEIKLLDLCYFDSGLN